MSTVHAAAASSLLAGLLDGGCELVEVARTRLTVHYETGAAGRAGALRRARRRRAVAHAVVTSVLPSGDVARRPGGLAPAAPRGGSAGGGSHPVPRAAPPGARAAVALDPMALVGRGPGLTPAGDDVLAGALVAAHAVR